MDRVLVEYHREGDLWWADSVDVPGWVAGGDSLEAARAQVWEGLPFFLDREVTELEILEVFEERPVVVVRNSTVAAFGTTTPSTSGAGASASPVRFVGVGAVALKVVIATAA